VLAVIIATLASAIAGSLIAICRWAARAHKDALDSYFGGGR